MNKAPTLAAASLVVLATGIVLYKTQILGYSMSEISNEPGYYVRLTMSCRGDGREVSVRLALPLLTDRQFILHEKQESSDFQYSIYTPGDNRIGHWEAADLEGEHTINYSFVAQPEAREYRLPDIEFIPESYPDLLAPYLEPDERIQSSDPLIVEKARELAGGSVNIPEIVRSTYDYLRNDVAYREFRGPTDAVTALKLREASCNGKNRLFVALCRSLGIPARMAGGLILKSGSKRTTHSWTEIWIGNEWVPFCVVNDYFARIPAHYLELYKGDRALLSHTSDIAFDYKWKIRERLRTEEEVLRSDADSEFNVLQAWARFQNVHVSLNLLLIILTLPVGATLITFTRNVVGIRTFGTFMPALMAVAFRDTGLIYGILTFCIVIAVGQAAVLLLDRLHILHIPKMAVLLTVVVCTILAIATIALRIGHTPAAAVSLFPLAIMTITSERFAVSAAEEGLGSTVYRFLSSLLVAAAAYELMSLRILHQVLISYPETLLYVMAANILLGMWTGLRFTEYIRFRTLRRAEA